MRVLFTALALLVATPTMLGEVKGGSPAEAPLVWPPPPAQPRIAFVKSISRPADAGAKVSSLGKLAGWITGTSKGNEALERPFGLAFDESDNLCLTDTALRTVCYFDSRSRKWLTSDRAGEIRFVSPVAVAKRGKTFYVVDSSLGALIAFDERFHLSFQVTNHLDRPTGVAVGNGNLLVVDSQAHKVVAFAMTGEFLSEFGRRGTGDGEFNFPSHIAADRGGQIYITDSMNCRVQVFDAQGRFLRQVGSPGDTVGHFGRPKGVALDSAGRMYVVDALFDNIQVFDAQGQLLLNLGGPGSGPGQFWLPNGIAINRKNEIYIADSYNRRVQVLKYIGVP